MGHLDLVDFLAQQGTNLHHPVAGDSASDCAADSEHLEVVEYISTSSPGRQKWGCRSLSSFCSRMKTQLDLNRLNASIICLLITLQCSVAFACRCDKEQFDRTTMQQKYHR